MERFKAVIRKEFAHIFRDPRSLSIVFVMPVFMIFIYGYSISFDLENIDIGVVDLSRSEHSARFLRTFANSGVFVLHAVQAGEDGLLETAERSLREGKLKEVVIIPADFAQDLNAGRQTEVGFIIDGSESNIANRVYQFNEVALQNFILEHTGSADLFRVSTKVFFNPELKSAYFFVPGLAAVLLLMIAGMLTSVSISKEKERGSIELLFISPLRAWEIILGKTVPYLSVALLAGVIILTFARFWFDIPLRGNLLVLLGFMLVYILSGLAFGVLISASAPTQRVAMLGTLLATVLPSILLSGFLFPLDSLGPVLRGVSRLIPATYFLTIIRGVVLKGAGISHFLKEGMILIGFSVILLFLASRKFAALRRSMR